MRFILKQYDIDLLSFDLSTDGVDGFACTILKKNPGNVHLLPAGLELTGAGVLSWLDSRIIPKNRAFVDKILSVYGLNRHNILGIIKLCFALSLNDSYWVVPEGFSGTFHDYNLYDNDFKKALSLIAYTGYGTVKQAEFTSSPEYTTNGNLRKGWRKIDGKIMLYKSGSSGAANTGNEPYSEFYAAQVAAAMGMNHLAYGLSKWKGSLCSTCWLFTDIDHSFVPAWRCFHDRRLSAMAAELRTMEDQFYQPFCDMMIFDALTYNTDRHLGNFGLMFENRTNRPYAFAPIFDNGLALFPFAMQDDFADLEKYAKSRISQPGADFDELANTFISERQRTMLRKLLDFKFTRHSRYNLPAKRLRQLEAFLRQRARYLLG